jgi:hypothetical protein
MDQKSQENLEAKLKEVRASDEFAKLTPEEQKLKLQKIKDEAQLTFGDFSKSEKYNPSQEIDLQAEELAKMEKALGTKPDDSKDKPLPSKQEKQESTKGFLHLLEAAEQNILKKTPIPFPTISLDSAGRTTPAFARMTKLTDYNNRNQNFQKIKESLNSDQDSEKTASLMRQSLILRLEIDFNNGHPQENLQDLSLEISLQAIHDQLQKGHRLTDILSAFTNLVLSASAEHGKRLTKSPAPTPNKKSSPENPTQTTQSSKKINYNSSGDLESLSGAFSQDSLSTVTFNSKSGQIWGELDLEEILATHQAPAESPDQISKEK